MFLRESKFVFSQFRIFSSIKNRLHFMLGTHVSPFPHKYTKICCRKFEDIFDVDHFIDYLKDDVRIVRDIPEWFTDKSELFTSIRFDIPTPKSVSIFC